MRLHTDHYFQIGHSHYIAGKPCQDFAISRTAIDGDHAFAVVSDGCSTGGNTDVGARILALATLTGLSVWGGSPAGLRNLQINKADNSQTLLGLHDRDMLATCVWAYANPEHLVMRVQGDGVLALKHKGGAITASLFEWNGNAPWYPAYRITDRAQYIERVHAGDASSAHLKITTAIWPGETWSSEVSTMPLDIYIGADASVGMRVPVADLEFAAVFTDGVTQIENLDWKDAVASLLSFKTTQGEFAKRRMIRELQVRAKNGCRALDDIAYAVIAFGQDGQ